MVLNRKAYNYCGHANKEDPIEDDVRGLNLTALESNAQASRNKSGASQAEGNKDDTMDVEKDASMDVEKDATEVEADI